MANDIYCSVAKARHAQGFICMSVATVQIPNVTYLVKEQVTYFKVELARIESN